MKIYLLKLSKTNIDYKKKVANKATFFYKIKMEI